jgi:hypothetical protein
MCNSSTFAMCPHFATVNSKPILIVFRDHCLFMESFLILHLLLVKSEKYIPVPRTLCFSGSVSIVAHGRQ